jgi:hypothetical protein
MTLVGAASYGPIKERRVLKTGEVFSIGVLMLFGCFALGTAPEFARYDFGPKVHF